MRKISEKSFTNTLVEILLDDKEVKVTGLGIFSIKKCKGGGKRTIHGKEVVTPDYNKISFRPTASLKRKIK